MMCIRIFPGLVCEPDDVDGPLIMAPVRDGDPHQLWHQDHWRQFRNAKVKNCIKINGTEFQGMTETDHVNKEACVLISKSTRRLLCCDGRDQLLRLTEYARGADGAAGAAVRRGFTLDMVSCDCTARSKLRYSCSRFIDHTVVPCLLQTVRYCNVGCCRPHMLSCVCVAFIRCASVLTHD